VPAQQPVKRQRREGDQADSEIGSHALLVPVCPRPVEPLYQGAIRAVIDSMPHLTVTLGLDPRVQAEAGLHHGCSGPRPSMTLVVYGSLKG
jgi:hypothetical protein